MSNLRHLLNTLFILTEDAYLSLKNKNVVVWQGDKKLGQVPLLTLENIVYSGRSGVSIPLIGACAESRGNVLLRRMQYRLADDAEVSCHIARNFIVGKLHNSKIVIARGLRDHPLSVNQGLFQQVIRELSAATRLARKTENIDMLRGIEGNGAHQYFSVFNDLILRDKNAFFFTGRVKRPPKGRVNSLLSFTYTLLAHDCASALESVGLDAYVGFMHTDRSGRVSLALDMMEELRSILADRFVLTLINNGVMKEDDFEESENDIFLMKDKGKKKFLAAWQDKKKEEIKHPFLEEKIRWGLVPYVQSLLLARFIRGDLSEYPAFLWK